MKTTEEILKAVLALHDPLATSRPGMVYEVWEDGEITLTKSGELYGLRQLHQISPPFPFHLPVDSLPNVNGPGTHSCIAASSHETATEARNLIAQLDPNHTISESNNHQETENNEN